MFTDAEAAASAVAVAVNPTGDPVSPPTDALAVCVPAPVPRVRVAVAIPFAPVMELAVIEPPPPVTDHVTVVPLTGLLFASTTSTE